ncbi:MAG: DUF1887 family CARF protein [Chloroflexota bacterium]|nr:DUF1887 family CARF protein [Chloroflexota bacterium]
MDLTGPHLEELEKALLSAFPDATTLARLARYYLDINLAEIANEGANLTDRVFHLTQWAVAHNRVQDLLAAAYEVNPRNLALQTFLMLHNQLGEPGVPGVMVCLVGEQPIPNLLPVLHYTPRTVVLVHSDHSSSRKVTGNLQQVIESQMRIESLPLEVDAYLIEQARATLWNFIAAHHWRPGELLFNLTGGTKTMSLAAYRVAQDMRDCRLMYLQSEGGRSLCHAYKLVGTAFVRETPAPLEITAVLTLAMYLRAYGLDSWQAHPLPATTPHGLVVQKVATALQGRVDEVITNLRPSAEADLGINVIVRCKNQVGIIEVRPGDEALAGVTQLVALAEPKYLGTYIRRFLILDHDRAPELREQAVARNITLIVLESATGDAGDRLSSADTQKLCDQVLPAFSKR